MASNLTNITEIMGFPVKFVERGSLSGLNDTVYVLGEFPLFELPTIPDEPCDDENTREGPDTDEMGEDAGELETGADG